MGLVTKSSSIQVIVDPLSFTSNIEVLSGNVSQIYNQESKEYESDRSIVPCVLMPSVSVSCSDETMNGLRPITGCEWFEGVPKPDGSNRIANNDKYEVSAEGKPQWSLTVRRNFEPNQPTQIFAVFTITDTRRGTIVKLERSISLYTTFYDQKILSLRLVDQPAGWVVDPLRIKPDAQGRWIQKITAQLYSGISAVPDIRAAYWWQVHESTGWRDFTADEKEIYISGEETRELQVDVRFFRNKSFRCRAAYYLDQRPSVPVSDALTVVSTIKVEMPKTLRADVVQTAGAKVDASLNTQVKYECILSDNVGIIGAEKDNLFQITWMAKTSQPGISPKKIGVGRSISFNPSLLGFEKRYTIAVYAVVKCYSVHALVTDATGKVVVVKGKAMTAIKYE